MSTTLQYNKVSAQKFFQAWIEIVTSRKDDMLRIWRNPREFTNYIISSDNSIMGVVANKLNLSTYLGNYYSLDTILYKPEDKTPRINPNNYFFRDIRVAFEHENYFNSGLYNEVSHLLITNCDLRVLVTYPDREIDDELNYLHEIITGNRQSKIFADEDSFLIIFGYETGFIWEGRVYKQDKWEKI